MAISSADVRDLSTRRQSIRGSRRTAAWRFRGKVEHDRMNASRQRRQLSIAPLALFGECSRRWFEGATRRVSWRSPRVSTASICALRYGGFTILVRIYTACPSSSLPKLDRSPTASYGRWGRRVLSRQAAPSARRRIGGSRRTRDRATADELVSAAIDSASAPRNRLGSSLRRQIGVGARDAQKHLHRTRIVMVRESFGASARTPGAVRLTSA